MNSSRTAGAVLLLAWTWVGVAAAQAPAPVPDLEPGVQTSAPPVAPKVAPKQPATPAASATAAAPKDAAKPKDHIELDTTQISGNRELPKVMYVVPWRRADLGDFAGRPPNSLLDEALTPVDRDVFRRQNRYYSALEAGAAAAKSQPDAAGAKAAGPEAKDEK
jgi:hypothetical protein